MNTRQEIIKLLQTTGRTGIIEMISWLDSTDFFTAPASSKFHGVYPGGLADHHLKVYKLLDDFAEYDFTRPVNFGQKALPVNKANIIIATLTHDFCKINKYYETEKGWQWDRKAEKGHAVLSIERVKVFIELEQIEEMMIRYHMGFYATWEYNSGKSGEYHVTNPESEASKEERYGKSFRNALYHNPIVKFMYICDEIASHTERITS